MNSEEPEEPLETARGFGANVRRLRQARHHSVYVFSELSGVSVSYLCSVERGERDVSIAIIGAIAKGLGIPMRDLFGPPEGIPERELNAVRMFAAASLEWRAVIWELLRYEPQATRKANAERPKPEEPKPEAAGMGKVIPIRGRPGVKPKASHGKQPSGTRISEPMTGQEFGALVRRLRMERNLTIEGLARLSGLTLGYVATIEKGDRQPCLSTLSALARGMGMSVRALLGGSEEQYSDEVKAFARAIATADEPLRKAILLLLGQCGKGGAGTTPNESA